MLPKSTYNRQHHDSYYDSFISVICLFIRVTVLLRIDKFTNVIPERQKESSLPITERQKDSSAGYKLSTHVPSAINKYMMSKVVLSVINLDDTLHFLRGRHSVS